MLCDAGQIWKIFLGQGDALAFGLEERALEFGVEAAGFQAGAKVSPC